MSIEIISNKFEVPSGLELIDVSRMYESLRYNDYSVENGLGEIVDNSVEAGAREIRIDFAKKIEKIGKKQIEEIQRIAVADNGVGMSEDILARCLVLGCSMRDHKNGRLGIGKFGVGMTLGGISLARRIEGYSSEDEAADFLYTYIDLDEIKAGKIEYRLDKTNIIHVPIGKASFTEEQLADNFQTLIDAINKARPAAVKGQFLKSVTLTSTMGPGVKVNPMKLA